MTLAIAALCIALLRQYLYFCTTKTSKLGTWAGLRQRNEGQARQQHSVEAKRGPCLGQVVSVNTFERLLHQISSLRPHALVA